MTKIASLFIFSVLAFNALADTHFESYLTQVPLARVHSELLQTGWYRIDEESRWRLGDPTDRIKRKIVKEMSEKLKFGNRIKLDTVLEFEKSVTCESMKDYQKELIHIEKDSSSSSYSSGGYYGGSAIAGYGFAAASVYGSSYAAGTSFSSHYLYHKSIREKYCAETGTYLRAKLKLTSRLKASAPTDFIEYAVNTHIEQTVFGLSGAMKVFVDGLNQIEQDPTIRTDRYSFFQISKGSEMSAWFTFYLSQLKIATDYLEYLNTLNLGLGGQGQISQLKMYTIEVLSKLRRFESPGIYILIIDDQTLRVSTLQLFDETMLSSVASFSRLLGAFPQSSAGDKVRIKNYSLLAKGEIQKNVERALAKRKAADLIASDLGTICPREFSVLAGKSDFEYLYQEKGIYEAGKTFLSQCGGRYFETVTKAKDLRNNNYYDAVGHWNTLVKKDCVVISIVQLNIFTSICPK